MTTWIICCFLSTLLSVLFAGILIPQILLVSYRRKLFDMPDERKIHRGTVPRLGGIAFTPVTCSACRCFSACRYSWATPTWKT